MTDVAVTGLVDSHCHLDRLDKKSFPDLDSVMRDTREAGVTNILCIGVDLETFPQVREVAERYPDVFASVGVHPLYRDSSEPTTEELVTLADHPRVVAIGETGLDYYYAKGETGWQQDRFRVHIQAARETGLPLIIHTRDARQDTIAMLREYGQGEVRGVLHCFTEDLDMARKGIELGFYVSISGIVTFRNADSLREVVRALPLERLLIETDAPWLAPVPHRGKPNQPAYVRQVAEMVAELQGVSVQALADATRENFFRLFERAGEDVHA